MIGALDIFKHVVMIGPKKTDDKETCYVAKVVRQRLLQAIQKPLSYRRYLNV